MGFKPFAKGGVMLKNPILILAAAVLLVANGFAADPKAALPDGNNNTLSVDSESLGPIVLDKKIKLMMRDGTYVEGKVVQASRESITMKVKKSEPKDRFPGNKAVLVTSDIGAIYLRKGGSIAAPIALGIGGGLAGAMVAGLALQDTNSRAGAAVAILALPTGGAIGGALLGRDLVKKTVTINVIQSKEP